MHNSLVYLILFVWVPGLAANTAIANRDRWAIRLWQVTV